MKWRDFFYFSKGERRSLIVLLSLITIATTLLIINERKPVREDVSVSETPSTDTQTSISTTDSSAVQTTAPSSVPKQNIPETKKVREPVSDRVKRLTSYSRPSYARSDRPRSEKFEKGVVVELNTADTTMLKKVPGIGSSYAKRIVGYRNLLGGYYDVTQLSEIYGMDEEHYQALVPWFTADPSLVAKIAINDTSSDSLIRRHPYLNREQTKVIFQLRRQKGKLVGWENLQLLNEFTDADRQRLQHYLSFE
jgi:DNA uptake protein ComE-like DNA-binding protein